MLHIACFQVKNICHSAIPYRLWFCLTAVTVEGAHYRRGRLQLNIQDQI